MAYEPLLPILSSHTYNIILIVRSSLVLYNAALAAADANQGNPILRVGQQQMAGFIHSRPGIRLLALPG